MQITVQVQKGPHKQVCDDAALVGSYLIDEGIHALCLAIQPVCKLWCQVGGILRVLVMPQPMQEQRKFLIIG